MIEEKVFRQFLCDIGFDINDYDRNIHVNIDVISYYFNINGIEKIMKLAKKNNLVEISIKDQINEIEKEFRNPASRSPICFEKLLEITKELLKKTDSLTDSSL